MPVNDFSPIVQQAPLLFAWLLYAVLHSRLANSAFKHRLAKRWPASAPPYRLCYNVLAALLLLPILALIWQTPGPDLWRWTGAAAWLANGAALALLLAFVWKGPAYDMAEFLGLRSPQATPSPRLVISAWHRHVRHPWYFLALVFIWTRDMNAASLTSAIAITLYFIVGSRLEEAKLVATFGASYDEYRQRVSGLFPLPWKALSAAEARRLIEAAATFRQRFTPSASGEHENS